jgi:hypothetical protein
VRALFSLLLGCQLYLFAPILYWGHGIEFTNPSRLAASAPISLYEAREVHCLDMFYVEDIRIFAVNSQSYDELFDARHLIDYCSLDGHKLDEHALRWRGLGRRNVNSGTADPIIWSWHNGFADMPWGRNVLQSCAPNEMQRWRLTAVESVYPYQRMYEWRSDEVECSRTNMNVCAHLRGTNPQLARRCFLSYGDGSFRMTCVFRSNFGKIDGGFGRSFSGSSSIPHRRCGTPRFGDRISHRPFLSAGSGLCRP